MSATLHQQIIRGQIGYIPIRKPDNWMVLELDLDNGTIARVAGVFPDHVTVGDTIEVAGKYTEHKEYGKQFRASHMLSCLSGKPEAIVAWLSTNLPQIGPERAKALVTRFKGDLWRTIEREPAQLLKIQGITEERLAELVETYAKVRGQRDFVLKLVGAGLDIKLAAELVSEMGQETFSILGGDPYSTLLRRRVPFEQIDSLAQGLFQITTTDPRRVRAFAHQVLFQKTYSEGHCYVMAFELVRETASQLKIKDVDVEAALKDYPMIVWHGKRVFLLEIDEAEQTVGDVVRRLLGQA